MFAIYSLMMSHFLSCVVLIVGRLGMFQSPCFTDIVALMNVTY